MEYTPDKDSDKLKKRANEIFFQNLVSMNDYFTEIETEYKAKYQLYDPSRPGDVMNYEQKMRTIVNSITRLFVNNDILSLQERLAFGPGTMYIKKASPASSSRPDFLLVEPGQLVEASFDYLTTHQIERTDSFGRIETLVPLCLVMNDAKTIDTTSIESQPINTASFLVPLGFKGLDVFRAF